MFIGTVLYFTDQNILIYSFVTISKYGTINRFINNLIDKLH